MFVVHPYILYIGLQRKLWKNETMCRYAAVLQSYIIIMLMSDINDCCTMMMVIRCVYVTNQYIEYKFDLLESATAKRPVKFESSDKRLRILYKVYFLLPCVGVTYLPLHTTKCCDPRGR